MKQKILTIAVGALALAGACGAAGAAGQNGLSRLYQPASVAAPGLNAMIAGQPEVIAPPSDIDPGMAIRPPAIGAPMPIIAPPGVPGGRFGIER
jgi:hypothetical protein